MSDVEMLEIPVEYTRENNITPEGIRLPIPPTQYFKYGTAGFRYRDEYMNFIGYRVGLWTALRLRAHPFEHFGIMITASHNPLGDNGVKIVEGKGAMLGSEDQQDVEEFVNLPDQDLLEYVMDGFEETKDNLNLKDLHVGWDTRRSSPYISLAIMTACDLVQVRCFTHGQVTTPQLHYVVAAHNCPTYGPTDDFIKRFADGVQLFMSNDDDGMETDIDRDRVAVDCANGVGANWLGKYLDHCNQFIVCNLINSDIQSMNLNYECGADFVKISRCLPAGFDPTTPPFCRAASFDGDADRLIYYYTNKDKQVQIMDGNQIAALFVVFLHGHLNEVPELQQHRFKYGVIHTAYTNGAAPAFYRNYEFQTCCTNTGVQNLEEAAREYDVGIYFEANGHGTVHFSDDFLEVLSKICANPDESSVWSQRILAFTQILNTVVGDAIADFLAVEIILKLYKWNVHDWRGQTYEDWPCEQIKIPVDNREFYESDPEDETILIRPPGLQARIDAIVANFPRARAFIRPSGTESILRLYVESRYMADVPRLAEELRALIPM